MKYPLTGIDLTALRSHKGNPELVCDNLCACEVTSRYTGRSCRGHAALAWESDALVRSHCRHDALSRPRRPAPATARRDIEPFNVNYYELDSLLFSLRYHNHNKSVR